MALGMINDCGPQLINVIGRCILAQLSSGLQASKLTLATRVALIETFCRVWLNLARRKSRSTWPSDWISGGLSFFLTSQLSFYDVVFEGEFWKLAVHLEVVTFCTPRSGFFRSWFVDRGHYLFAHDMFFTEKMMSASASVATSAGASLRTRLVTRVSMRQQQKNKQKRHCSPQPESMMTNNLPDEFFAQQMLATHCFILLVWIRPPRS